MDAISLHQHGITNVVASLGTALTDSQARLLKKYTDEVIISYDADTAGQAATLRGLETLSDAGCDVCTDPAGGQGPRRLRKEYGADKFRWLANNALPLVEYKIRVIRKQHDLSATGEKIKFLSRAADVLVKVENALEREMYIKKLAREYEVSEEAMHSEVIRRTRPAAVRRTKMSKTVGTAGKLISAAESPKEKIIHGERFVLSLLCVDNSIYDVVKEHFKIGDYVGEENNRIAGIIYGRIEEGSGVSPAELMNIVSDGESGIFARILNDECHCDDNEKAILGKIRDIELMKTEMRRDQIIDLLKNKSRLSENEVDKLESELRELIQN